MIEFLSVRIVKHAMYIVLVHTPPHTHIPHTQHMVENNSMFTRRLKTTVTALLLIQGLKCK